MNARVLDTCHLLHKHMRVGRVTPFLGAGATRAGRAPNTDWRTGNYLPDGAELAEFLAEEYQYPCPVEEPKRELERVAQYADLVSGASDLFNDLHTTFAGEQEPNLVHCYLAGQVARARKSKVLQNPWPVIVTTNYDDLLEQAFARVDEQYHVLTYLPTGGRGGRPIFVHQPPDRDPRPITKVKDYVCEPEGPTVIVKLHGSVSRTEPPSDSFVITENDYIAYIESRVQRLLPAHLLYTMQDGHFLFLGYKLEDWHVRAFLFALWRRRVKSAKSWAIDLKPTMVAGRYWLDHDVEVLELSLEAWVENMLALEGTVTSDVRE